MLSSFINKNKLQNSDNEFDAYISVNLGRLDNPA